MCSCTQTAKCAHSSIFTAVLLDHHSNLSFPILNGLNGGDEDYLQAIYISRKYALRADSALLA